MNHPHVPSSNRSFTNNWRQDHQRFPYLLNVINGIKNHPGIIGTAPKHTQAILKKITEKDGKYAVENMRIQEWVCSVVLEILLNKLNTIDWVKYTVYQTRIHDDIHHHVDARIVKTYSGSKENYGVDFTFDKALLEQKALALNTHPAIITIRWEKIQLPTMVVHLPRATIDKITSWLERTLKIKGVPDIKLECITFAIECMVHEYLSKWDPLITTCIPSKYSPYESLKEISRRANSHR